MATSYQFLPWVRRGLTVALDALDNLGNLPAHAEASVGVRLAAPHAGEAIAPAQALTRARCRTSHSAQRQPRS